MNTGPLFLRGDGADELQRSVMHAEYQIRFRDLAAGCSPTVITPDLDRSIFTPATLKVTVRYRIGTRVKLDASPP